MTSENAVGTLAWKEASYENYKGSQTRYAALIFVQA